jgi:hypothetical protein
LGLLAWLMRLQAATFYFTRDTTIPTGEVAEFAIA